MEYSYKFRLYPNKEQEDLIQRTFGCCRFVWNHYLALRGKTYEESGKTMSFYDCSRDMTQLKKALPWLKEVDATSLQSSIRALDAAYQNFFRRVKQGKKTGYPRFKSKRNHRNSYKSKCVGANIKVLDKAVQLPKLGLVKCRISKEVKGRILSATVSQNPSGKYFVALCCTDVELEPLPSTGAAIGLNMGFEGAITASDGTKYLSYTDMAKTRKKLIRLQRQLSRKSKGSKRWEKARVKIAKLYERIVNQNNDTRHKLSTNLVRNYDLIVIGNYAPSDIDKAHKNALSISGTSWGEFRRQLEYKAAWYGKQTVTVDSASSSPQFCSCCGAQCGEVEGLPGEKWTCPVCGAAHDRDVNAAKNILNEGLCLLA